MTLLMLIFFSINLVKLRIVRHRTNSGSLTFVDSGCMKWNQVYAFFMLKQDIRAVIDLISQPVSGYELVYTE